MSDNKIMRLGDEAFGIEVWTIGARLNDVWIDGRGGLQARSDSVEDALGDSKNNGAVVGPVANRLARAEALVGDQVFQLEPNEDGKNICHNGTKGVNTKIWTVESETADTLVLSLDLADGEDDLPGNRRLTATYRLVENGFDLDFSATSDAPTLVNLALHPYWTLDRRGRDGQEMCVNADRYTPIDEEKIPTGEIAPVDDTIFDLRTAATPSRDIDHNFCLNEMGPAAIMIADSGLRLTITTDAPGLQIYTGNPIGIAVEPQHWPDAPHHDGFPSILLEPGQTYAQSSQYRFSR